MKLIKIHVSVFWKVLFYTNIGRRRSLPIASQTHQQCFCNYVLQEGGEKFCTVGLKEKIIKFLKVKWEDWYHSNSPPCRSTGFILEGFPHTPNDVHCMLQQHLFPDLVVIMAAEVSEVQKRLLPTYLKEWQEKHDLREAQLTLLRDLRKKNRVSKWQLGRMIVFIIKHYYSCLSWPHGILHEYLEPL